MCLYGCLDPLVADVIHAGLHVLYLPAVGTKDQIKHGLPVGDFLSFGSKEYLRAALLGVAGDICQTFTVQFMQVYKEGTEYGILLCDKGSQLFGAMYAVTIGACQQRTVSGKDLGPVSFMCRLVIQRTEERADFLYVIQQFRITGIGGKLIFEGQEFLIGTRLRKNQP